MSQFDYQKYAPYPPMVKADRRWPDQTIQHAPVWCSVDLRDGNQALVEPMSPVQKLALFTLLVGVGFTEIEVGFPAASQPDFDFVRQLIEQDLIPDNVTIQVLTQAREELIVRSFASLKGVRRAIVHLYNPTSTVQRKQVFGQSREAIKSLAVQGAKWIKNCAENQPATQWRFQYSPESFTGTEIDYAIEVCDAVNDVWKPTPDQPVIINLPATVEMSTPNVYADQIEWVCDHIAHREAIIISLHTHNDRGCGIAAAELGVMAGADRIEGTLLGNGERTGNMDVVTMAMNLYSRGIDPELDLSNMDRIIHTVESCTKLEVHPRHPYAGELVFAAFSGSHQDAINKCLLSYKEGDTWDIPYLPIDPRDVGRSYQEVIRINSQSGKGGIAHVLHQACGVQLPRWMQLDISPYVQKESERCEGEVSAETIVNIFHSRYLQVNNAYSLDRYSISYNNDVDHLSATIAKNKDPVTINAIGKGPLEAFINALSANREQTLILVEFNEHTLGHNERSEAMAYVQISVDGQRYCGAGKSSDIVKASLQAVLNALEVAENNQSSQLVDVRQVS